MKITTLVASALIATSSTAAMAGSFTFQARASASFHVAAPTYQPVVITAPVVRDHRDHYVYVNNTNQLDDSRFGSVRQDDNDRGYDNRPVTRPTMNVDCRNWDPVLEVNSQCSVYGMNDWHGLPQLSFRGWTALGARESSVPDMQFITVESSYSSLYVMPIQGRPSLASIGIKFMDGTWQTINIDGNLGRGQMIRIDGGARHKISQIGFHAEPGSRGAYSVFAQ
jgi:hypothetical protein